MSTAYKKAYDQTVAGMKIARKVAEESDPEDMRLVKCRNYQTNVGSGWATFCLTLPKNHKKHDISDLREWLKIIDRQLARLEDQGVMEVMRSE